MKIDGGCHCGYITYEAMVDPELVGICHCTDCQTLSGSAFRTVVFAPKDAFKLLTGKPKLYIKTAESGAKRAQAFCSECGTPVYSAEVGDSPFSVFALERRASEPSWFRRFKFGAVRHLAGLRT